ncbi:hypothetical protein I7I51_07872 [Histoplasma capsulatum]|uniref:Uncharacterized protein n=1 Tax=Ajellomyces capsulatus TaxID=5037 RepID=A0A8A1LWB5_AJECA|nr:hypothetical protein I7I51_07872 [Histoplasma capsulatum]
MSEGREIIITYLLSPLSPFLFDLAHNRNRKHRMSRSPWAFKSWHFRNSHCGSAHAALDQMAGREHVHWTGVNKPVCPWHPITEKQSAGNHKTGKSKVPSEHLGKIYPRAFLDLAPVASKPKFPCSTRELSR